MEGGGNSRDTKVALRQGMDDFLEPVKKAVQQKRWYWKLVPCGGRVGTYRKFTEAIGSQSQKHHIVILLVDAEGQVNGAPHEHLKFRDGWAINTGHRAFVHLMAQTMETWIISDHNALSTFYGSGFVGNALPRAHNLEEISKDRIVESLSLATRNTARGKYRKIRHARDLLGRLELEVVKDRCPHCKRFFTVLENSILGN